ncbi:GAF and ANTAR domain-containing protein [Kibdelosporangium persicum]|uniref:Two-component system response regulator n=1 Tax=Kibdelosporangium persicum TaxID=2698649 RepID=A0ABX2FIX5_9PSEU|nr:GAF and ANTAR domain-containing protein [Kibdelosporangium persicum]NRN71381.1 Two-component system response regulator [Kibdelosporangium persicum]
MVSLDRAAEMLDEFTSAMTNLTEALDAGAPSREILDAVCAEAIRAIPGADMASITAISDSHPRTAAYTDPRARQLDQAQYDIGDGPCLRAARTGAIIRLSVGTASEMWPDFVAVAKRLEVGSYLAAPLHVDDNLAGAINLFGFGDHGFAEVDEKLLGLYTTVVTFALRTTRRYHNVRKLAVQFETAMQSRAVIEQAKGILMAIHKVSEAEAIARLIDQSQRTNVKLRIVAADFVHQAIGGTR